MSVSKNDLVNGKGAVSNGKESVSSEAKRLFTEINFGTITKSEFVSKMLDGVVASANDIHSMVKHLEAVWRGKAAPTIAELNKAKNIVEPEASSTPPSRVDKAFARMNIGTTYEPKYDTTKKLKTKMQASKS